MKHCISAIIASAVMLLLSISAQAQTEVRFHNEAVDTVTLTRLLDEGAGRRFTSPEARVAFFARKFIGTPDGAHTLEGEPEMLTVNLDSLDCTTFVEVSMALAFTVNENRTSWRDFVYNLRRIRYRNGEVDGYPSRLHYICDWAVDNKHRGNFSDVTREGITIAAPGFYAPQGRWVRLEPQDAELNAKIESFGYHGRRITNFEMEGSALAGLAALMGHRAATICTIIAQRIAQNVDTDYKPFVRKMISTALDKLAVLK